jgi:phage-related holin
MSMVEFAQARPDQAAILALLVVMAVDTLLALLIAAKDGKVSAAEMQKGITKIVGTLLIVLGVQLVSVLVPDLTGGIPAGALAATAYVGVQLLSIARHMAVLEIGIPAPLRGVFARPRARHRTPPVHKFGASLATSVEDPLVRVFDWPAPIGQVPVPESSALTVRHVTLH